MMSAVKTFFKIYFYCNLESTTDVINIFEIFYKMTL